MIDYTKEFKGKKVLVTGGSKGIGAATADRLVRGGATVAVTARNYNDELSKDIIFIQGDVSTLEGATQVAHSTLESLGSLDVLINNVGATKPRLPGIEAISDDDWIENLMVNFMSAVRVTRLLLSTLKQSKAAVIVNTSAGGLLPFHGFLAHYGASKAALVSYTRSLARELAPQGIRVNIVTPGAILTPGGDEGRNFLTAGMGITLEQLFAAIPQGRAGTVTEIAETIAFIVSERSSYITGHDFHVAGGQGEIS